jgi:hypothetical protein
VSAALIVNVVKSLLPQQPAAWERWLVLALLVTAVVYTLYGVARLALPGLYRRFHLRRLERQVREPTLCIAERLLETMSTSFGRSAGCLLHPLTAANVLDARSHCEYNNHLATFYLALQWMIEDVRSGRLAPTTALSRLLGIHQNYVRVCDALGEMVLQANRESVYRAWDEVREYANWIGHRLSEVHQQVQIACGETRPPTYVAGVTFRAPKVTAAQ